MSVLLINEQSRSWLPAKEDYCNAVLAAHLVVLRGVLLVARTLVITRGHATWVAKY